MGDFRLPCPWAGRLQSSRACASPFHAALGPLLGGQGLRHSSHTSPPSGGGGGVREAVYRWPREPHPELALAPPFLFSLPLCLSFFASFYLCLCVTPTLSRDASTPTPFSVLFAESPVILSLHPVSQPYYPLSLPSHLPCLPPIPHLIARLSWSTLPSPPCSLGVKINRGPGPWNISRKYREKISNLSSPGGASVWS